jgi:hypothetical protein
MALAQDANAYGVDSLHAVVAAPRAAPVPPTLLMPGAPLQVDIDRALAGYEAYVQGAGRPTLAMRA